MFEMVRGVGPRQQIEMVCNGGQALGAGGRATVTD